MSKFTINKLFSTKSMLSMAFLMLVGHEEMTAQTYCTPTPAPVTNTYYINNFSTTGGLTNITNNGTGMSTGGYGNFTTMSCSAIQGTSLSFSSAFYSSSTFGARIWLDWNHDGDFDDTGEQIFATTTYVSSISGTINVPLTAVPGMTRMRIRIHWLSGTGPVACNETNSASYIGEAEDYSLNVIPIAPPNNAGVGTLITPDNSPRCSNANYDVSVSVLNLGSNALNSANVNWSINGVLQTPVILPVALPNYKDSTIVLLGSVLFPTTAPLQLKAWTDMPNGLPDPQHSDDTLNKPMSATLQGVYVNITPHDTIICSGTSINLDAGEHPKNPIYIWSDATLTETMSVSGAGVYYVKVQNTDGCFDYDTVTVLEHPNPLLNSIAVIDDTHGHYTFSAIGAQNITAYSWDFGDGYKEPALGMAPGTPGQAMHQYVTAGQYQVKLTVSNDCGEKFTTRPVLTTGIPTGIDNVSRLQQEMTLFPNPSKSVVTISNNVKIKITSISVFNILGQKMLESSKINADKYEMNISSLAVGLYNVVIETEEGRLTKKLEVIK